MTRDPIVLAAVSAACAVAVAMRPSWSAQARRLQGARVEAGSRAPVVPENLPATLLASRALVTVCAVVVAGVVTGLTGSLVLAPVALVVALLSVAAVRRGRERRAAGRRREALVEVCAVMSSELRAGRSSVEAMHLAGAEEPASTLLRPALRAVAVGADVAGALRSGARVEGAQALTRLAACWEVAADSGAGLAAGLDRLADALRAEEGVRREVGAQAAAPRSTARMLACLPLLALGMASATGADAVGVLLHTPVGWVCLTAGVTCTVAGLWWSEAIVSRVERRI